MIQEMWNLLVSRWDFFGGLLLEHIEISLVAILIAILFGGLAGILISEFQRLAKPTLGVINFLYTIPSISMLRMPDIITGMDRGNLILKRICIRVLPMPFAASRIAGSTLLIPV